MSANPQDGRTENSVTGGLTNSTAVQLNNLHGPLSVYAPGSMQPVPALSPPRSWPRCSTVHPVSAGTHHTPLGKDGSTVTPYVARGHDQRLRELIRQAGQQGGFVLVTGGSSTGKTRTAFEAARAELPRHRFLVPRPGSDLAALPALLRKRRLRRLKVVLWLDDLQRYLGPQGLDSSLVAELTHTRVVIVATLNDRAHSQLTAEERRLLIATEPLQVVRRWSNAEAARARQLGDDRLTLAVRTSQERRSHHGVAEYLAAAPQMLQAWRAADRPREGGVDAEFDGHPRGYALVTAAVDLVRLGFEDPLPKKMLTKLHQHYLSGTDPTELESFEESWRWATQKRHGVGGLLSSQGPEGNLCRPFFYLVETSAPISSDGIPDTMWDAALDHADRPLLRFEFALRAYAAQRPEHARRALQANLSSDGTGLSPSDARLLNVVLSRAQEPSNPGGEHPTDLMTQLVDPDTRARIRHILARDEQERPLSVWRLQGTPVQAPASRPGVPRVGEVVNERLYLNVPFSEKSQAKLQANARWDRAVKKWWVRPDTPQGKIARWL